jgi:hypothetical protein
MAACTCSVCKKEFVSVTDFDVHRTGTYEPNTRRCLTDVEMTSRGFHPGRAGRLSVSKVKPIPVGWTPAKKDQRPSSSIRKV